MNSFKYNTVLAGKHPLFMIMLLENQTKNAEKKKSKIEQKNKSAAGWWFFFLYYDCVGENVLYWN